MAHPPQSLICVGHTLGFTIQCRILESQTRDHTCYYIVLFIHSYIFVPHGVTPSVSHTWYHPASHNQYHPVSQCHILRGTATVSHSLQQVVSHTWYHSLSHPVLHSMAQPFSTQYPMIEVTSLMSYGVTHSGHPLPHSQRLSGTSASP